MKRQMTATDLRIALAAYADFCLDSLAEGHDADAATVGDFMATCADVFFRNMDFDTEPEVHGLFQTTDDDGGAK